MGFHSIGDGFLGHEHYLNAENMNDDKILDPDHPESLVYDTSVTPKRLVAAIYMLNAGDTLDDVPDVGGARTRWPIPDNPCFAPTGRVSALTDTHAAVRPGLPNGHDTPQMH